MDLTCGFLMDLELSSFKGAAEVGSDGEALRRHAQCDHRPGQSPFKMSKTMVKT